MQFMHQIQARRNSETAAPVQAPAQAVACEQQTGSSALVPIPPRTSIFPPSAGGSGQQHPPGRRSMRPVNETIVDINENSDDECPAVSAQHRAQKRDFEQVVEAKSKGIVESSESDRRERSDTEASSSARLDVSQLRKIVESMPGDASVQTFSVRATKCRIRIRTPWTLLCVRLNLSLLDFLGTYQEFSTSCHARVRNP